jgi:hypothetical protein
MTGFESAATRRLALAALGAGIAATTMAADATAAPADQASLEKAVEDLRAAMVAGDGNALKRLLSDRLSYSHSDAHLQNKGQVLNELAGKHAFVSITQSKQTVDIVGNVGVVRFVFDGVGILPDGKTSPSHIFVLQVWLRSRRSWQLLARASTPLPPA